VGRVGMALDQPFAFQCHQDRYRLLSYHRAGFAGSDRIEGPVSIGDHAAHCALLMRQLGIERAHIVGHSSSADIALQLALDFPDAVHTLGLMEPARPFPPTEEAAEFARDVVGPAVQRYRAGDKVAAVDAWARGVFGPDYRGALERGLPGVFDQCVADADVFFAQEMPAVQQWSFTAQDAGRITQPALAIVGDHTAPTFLGGLQLLVSWLPNAEVFELPRATHCCTCRTRGERPRPWPPSTAGIHSQHPPPASTLTANKLRLLRKGATVV
jgi:pimeloyl-ACP methyl ester carboxylesterase